MNYSEFKSDKFNAHRAELDKLIKTKHQEN